MIPMTLSEDEATDFFAAVYRGKHRIPGKLRRDSDATWSCVARVDGAGLSSFDFDELTRLVLLAHDRCYRLALYPSSPRHIRMQICDRCIERSELQQVARTLGGSDAREAGW